MIKPPEDQTTRRPWINLFTLLLVTVLLYVFMEWLFIVTKPSMLDVVSVWVKFAVLVFSSALLVGLASLLLGLLAMIAKMIKSAGPSYLVFQIAIVLPASVMAALVLLLIDNFTYTLFKFGIVTSQGLLRAVYALTFLGLLIYFYRWYRLSLNRLNQAVQVKPGLHRLPLLGLVGLLLAGALSLLLGGGVTTTSALSSSHNTVQTPHILIFTADGVDASHLSIYGYQRDTSPRLRQLAASALVAENAFPNSPHTSGSIISLLTSKTPDTTRVIYPPDILRGSDAYEHLPGLLQASDYNTVQFSYPHYVDAYTLNIRNGFIYANGRKANANPILAKANQVLPAEFSYFLYDVGNRLIDRLRHIFFIKQMTNPALVVNDMGVAYPDSEKIDRLLDTLETSSKPVFAHIHLMGTHGDRFYPPRQVFSAGQDISKQEPYETDFYDDAILEADAQIGRVIDYLTEHKLLENTILVFASDHGQEFIATKRLPWVIHFPYGQFAGRIQASVQNLDIAPTILEFIGREKPEWMEGKSILSGIEFQRPIFAVSAAYGQRESDGYWRIDTSKIKPPFFQLNDITVMYCQSWVRLRLTNNKVISGTIDGYTAPCSENDLLTEDEGIALILQHLREKGFDIASLETIFPLPVK